MKGRYAVNPCESITAIDWLQAAKTLTQGFDNNKPWQIAVIWPCIQPNIDWTLISVTRQNDKYVIVITTSNYVHRIYTHTITYRICMEIMKI